MPAVQADFYSMLSQHGKRLCCSLYVAAFPRTHARTHARTSSQLERGAASSPASTEGSGLSYAQRFSKTHRDGPCFDTAIAIADYNHTAWIRFGGLYQSKALPS